MGKPDATGASLSYGLEKPFTVGTTVSNHIGHVPERYGKIVAKICGQIARNSTHGNLKNKGE
jgi:hypothetical protein